MPMACLVCRADFASADFSQSARLLIDLLALAKKWRQILFRPYPTGPRCSCIFSRLEVYVQWTAWKASGCQWRVCHQAGQARRSANRSYVCLLGMDALLFRPKLQMSTSSFSKKQSPRLVRMSRRLSLKLLATTPLLVTEIVVSA